MDVSKKDNGKVKMKYVDQQSGGVAAPFVIRPDAPLRYFQEPQSMLTLYMGMLSNPMLLLMFAVVALMACMQYIDPEAMQDLQKEVSGQKGKEKAPHQTLPSLIAKPKQGNKLSRQLASSNSSSSNSSSGLQSAQVGTAITSAFASDDVAHDSDSQEEDDGDESN